MSAKFWLSGVIAICGLAKIPRSQGWTVEAQEVAHKGTNERKIHITRLRKGLTVRSRLLSGKLLIGDDFCNELRHELIKTGFTGWMRTRFSFLQHANGPSTAFNHMPHMMLWMGPPEIKSKKRTIL